MDIIHSTCNVPVPAYLKEHFPLEQVLIFDIETTGFSALNSQLYLIGCMYFQQGVPKICQWFADTFSDEVTLISGFGDFIKDYKYLIHFNGNGFDIPYLTQKAQALEGSCDFSHLESIDLYKILFSFKRILKLENLKQKTVEQYMDIHRDDLYNGGELISVYLQYLKSPEKEAKDLLLLHNHDDICGLLKLMPLLSFADISREHFQYQSTTIQDYTSYDETTGKEAYISFSLPAPLPKAISFSKDDFYLTIQEDTGKLRIPLYHGELKYFYKDYKNYYYLPMEDTAIHKSVAEYVDKEYRQKAKAQNCYCWKTGLFLPQLSEVFTPSFQAEYKDSISYFELTSANLENTSGMNTYLWELFSYLLKMSR